VPELSWTALGPALTIPNLITSFRLVAGPVCLYLLMSGASWALWLALVVMICAELSDMFDGMVARALGQVSDLGKLLDPLADSIYRVAVFLAFVAQGWMPAWMMIVILVRDLVVANVRVVAGARGVTMAARTSGKIKAIVQAAAQLGTVVLLAAFAAVGWTSEAIFALLMVAVLVTAWSMLDYAAAVARPKVLA
jgi:CDP-diacylglycerol--glycerol-3-phosphate 3-phosphatidyltransferase